MRDVVISITVVGSLAALAIVYCSIPWSAMLLLTGMSCGLCAYVLRHAGPKIVMANIAGILAALALFEGYLGIENRRGDGTHMEGTIVDGFTHADNVLGYVPNSNSRVTARKLYGKSVLYDVVYTIGSDGLRIAPPVNAGERGECIVFFGDSVTFGEGVNDDQAYPYQVGMKSGGRYAIHNFAFSGYGPHQMLAALQAGLIERTAACTPTNLFYLGFVRHVARVAGLTTWDKHGPRFRINADGAAVRDGNFDSPPVSSEQIGLKGRLAKVLGSSYAWQKFFGHGRDLSAADLRLFLAVVHASADAIRSKFPNVRFHFVLWDGMDDRHNAVIEASLKERGIPIYTLTAMIPDFKANWGRYVISPHDMHPNAIQHEIIANYLLRNAIAPEPK